MNRVSRHFFAICALLFVLALPLVRTTPAKDEWPPISQEELAMKNNPASPDAHAMILYREVTTNDPESFETNYERIKIFAEEGKKYGDIEIPFVKGASDVKDIRARTVRADGSVANFEGKTFEKLIVKASGLRVSVKAFSLPDVQPGCIIEYKYRIQYDPQMPHDTRWTVQENLFTRRARFTDYPYPNATARTSSYWTFGLKPNQVPQKQKDGSLRLELENVPAFEEEAYMPPEVELKSRVEFFYTEHAEKEEPLDFWKRIGKERNEQVDRFTSKGEAIQQVVAQTTSPSDSPEAKLRKLYARAQQVRNLDYGDERTQQDEKRKNLKSNDNVEDVIKRGVGSGRDINRFLLALARGAGFEADEVQIASRNQAFFHPEWQDVRQLRTEVVLVHMNGQDIFLEPACKFCPYGLLPWYEAGVYGIRLTKQGGVLVTTATPRSADAVLARRADLSLDGEGTLVGKLEVNFHGQRAISLREDTRDEDETGRRKSVADEIKGWLPAGSSFDLTNITGWEGSEESLRAEGTVRIPGIGVIAGHRILLPVGIFELSQKPPFQHTQRTYAVYFHYPSQKMDDIKIKLPDGYRIESLPTPRQTPAAGIMVYQMSFRQETGVLRVQRREAIEGFVIPVRYYSAVWNYFTLKRANDELQAVLQQADQPKSN
jgi:transglutaminase-like putative cysteine protease